MAGVYFRITETSTNLSGYLRAGGCLQVLGLIHASVEFMLMVTYREAVEDDREGDPEYVYKITELYGTATLTVSIELLFFSIDVAITMEKHIAGTEDRQRRVKGGTPENDSLDKKPTQLQRPAYFASDHLKEDGRFPWDERDARRSAEKWNSQYWSQFQFC
ncbi:MAG: hypothetical protein QM703_14180 [Gemmatales bacterium]